MSDVTPQYVIPDGLMAMTTDDGTVITLLKRDTDNGGAVIRTGGNWIPLTDPSTLDGLNFVGVVDGAVEIYDTNEGDGNLANVSSYPASEDGPFWTDVSEDEGLVLDEETGEYSRPGEQDEEPLAASVTLDTADDLDSAIAAAADDPDLQWYVERRVAALGLEAALPWQGN